MSDVIKIVVERNQVSGVRVIDGQHVMHTQQEINRTIDSFRATEIVSGRLGSNNFSWGTELDAQRLRADTAEATVTERDEALALKQRDLIEAQAAVTGWASKHAAAEKRIADQLKLIVGLVEYANNLLSDVNSAWQYAGSTGNPETHWDTDYVAAVAMIAALNLKPEAGSHE